MNDLERQSRGSLALTRAWFAGRPGRGALVVLMLGAAAVASVEGLLRWSAAPMRWSFAALCLAAALWILRATLRGTGRG